MSGDVPARPRADTWVAAIHTSEEDFTPIGTAVVIDEDRVLTCAHVVARHRAVREPLWVAFPKADNCPRRRVASVAIPAEPEVHDVAVLVLQERVPTGVQAAPVRCPKPIDLVSLHWWAFGFPPDPFENRVSLGNEAHGVVGVSLAHGWVHLETSSRYALEKGFSGAGLWSRDYEAVVGVVGQAHSNGDGRAVTLYQADLCFPKHKIAVLAAAWTAESAGMVALEQWGWTVACDPEGIRHWQPRARGVSIESERGYRFRGRKAALSRIVEWLDRPHPDRRVLVVTGSPGVGKSSVLGRIVTTADPDIRASLPQGDQAICARVGSVGCAVHAKAKTALEVAEEIARAASARLPDEAGDLAPAVCDVLAERNSPRFNVIIDALDEAVSPAQTRAIVNKVVLPLTETCARVGVQVIVGTRRRDDGGDLLRMFGGTLAPIDLDDPEYFAEEDLDAYSLACLQLAGDERAGSPYTDDTAARPLARRIAVMSGGNFLVAGLTARSHGLHDQEPADPDRLAFPVTVDAALADYLQHLGPADRLSAGAALTALAFAEAPGLSADLWGLAAEAIAGTLVSAADLTRFARSSAANFLVENSDTAARDQGANTTTVYRLFHQALNDALLRARSDVVPRADDERALTQAFTRHGRLSNWKDAPGYLLRSLPGHAATAGLVDELLTDDAYLLYADLRRLMLAAHHATTQQARRSLQLIGLTPQAVTAASGERAALFSVTQALEGLGADYASTPGTPYLARWAHTFTHGARIALEGHLGVVRALCPVTVAGRELIAGASEDGTVRIWDPATGRQEAATEGHPGKIYAMCPVIIAGRQLLACGGQDHTVRICEPGSGLQEAVLQGHRSFVSSVCPVTVRGRELLASASKDKTVRIWDPVTGHQEAVLQGHQGWVHAVCQVTVGGRELLASASEDKMVRIWDPATGEQEAVLHGHQSRVEDVCSVTVAGQQLLASASLDNTLRIWDPATGEQKAVLEGQYGPCCVCAVTVAGRELLASAGVDRTVRIWDPLTGLQDAVLEGHTEDVEALCAVSVAGRQLLASASDDGTVLIWDPTAVGKKAAPQGHRDHVSGVCPVTVAGRQLLASASFDGTVRIWDAATGRQKAILEGHQDRVWGVCPVTMDGRDLLASAGADGTVRIWDAATGRQEAVLEANQGQVFAVCTVTVAGSLLLASAGDDGTARIWDPTTGKQKAVLQGHALEVDPPGVSGGPQTWKDEGSWRHSGNTRRSCGNAR